MLGKQLYFLAILLYLKTSVNYRCKIFVPTSIAAIVNAASQSHAIASAVSPVTSIRAICHRIWCGIERFGIWLRIWIGYGARHGLRVQPPAVALAINVVAGGI
jgi:hypothetical protein